MQYRMKIYKYTAKGCNVKLKMKVLFDLLLKNQNQRNNCNY